MTEKNGDLKYKTDNAIDEAYRRGYADGVEHTAEEFRYEISNSICYKRGYVDGVKSVHGTRARDIGREEAWECARKIACIRTDAEWKEFFEFLDVKLFHPEDIFTKYTASEAMQKIKDYEERQTEEIKVGDEVKVYDDCIGIVTRHAPQARTCYVMYRDGSCGEEELTDCKKTGNHSMSLDKWFEQMREESHEKDT